MPTSSLAFTLTLSAAYQSELLAVRTLLPWRGLVLVAIGVGTGRFSSPLGIQVGIVPAGAVLDYAVNRGISTVQAFAEALPFADNSFDYAPCVTTICFVDDVTTMLSEACTNAWLPISIRVIIKVPMLLSGAP